MRIWPTVALLVTFRIVDSYNTTQCILGPTTRSGDRQALEASTRPARGRPAGARLHPRAIRRSLRPAARFGGGLQPSQCARAALDWRRVPEPSRRRSTSPETVLSRRQFPRPSIRPAKARPRAMAYAHYDKWRVQVLNCKKRECCIVYAARALASTRPSALPLAAAPGAGRESSSAWPAPRPLQTTIALC